MGGDEIRREHILKRQERNGLVFVVNERDPYSGVIFDHFKNGQLALEVTYKNGLKDGPLLKWHQNGQIAHERYYRAGKRIKPWRSWHENGELRGEDPADKEEQEPT